MTASYKQQSDAELKGAKTLNTVAQIGAAHAIYSTVKERANGSKIPRHKLPSTRLAARAVRKVPGGSKTLALAPAAGWVGFHGAEWAGDVMARRSINNQLVKPKEKVAKADPSGFGQRNSHGTSLISKATKGGWATDDKKAQGSLAGGLALAGSGSLLAVKGTQEANRAYGVARKLNRTSEIREAVGLGSVEGSHLRSQAKGVKKIGLKHLRNAGAGVAAMGAGAALVRHAGSYGEKQVSKARRFDPEADRQRRLGAYSGLAGGAAIVAGDQARQTFRNEVVGDAKATPDPLTGKKPTSRLVGFKGGKSKRGLALTAATAGLAGVSAAALKRGVSERNASWT